MAQPAAEIPPHSKTAPAICAQNVAAPTRWTAPRPPVPNPHGQPQHQKFTAGPKARRYFPVIRPQQSVLSTPDVCCIPTILRSHPLDHPGSRDRHISIATNSRCTRPPCYTAAPNPGTTARSNGIVNANAVSPIIAL